MEYNLLLDHVITYYSISYYFVRIRFRAPLGQRAGEAVGDHALVAFG